MTFITGIEYSTINTFRISINSLLTTQIHIKNHINPAVISKLLTGFQNMSCFHKAQPLGHASHGIDACDCLSVFMYVCPHPEDAWTFKYLLDSLNRQTYHIKKNKSSLRVKLNLLKCADSSLNTIRHMPGVMSPVSPVTSHM